MSMQDDELRRLQQLRERQLQARDPLKKERKKQQHISKQYKARKKYTLADGIADLSHKVKGLFIGGVLGFIAAILIWSFVDTAWADLLGLLAILILAILGFVFGSSLDWRDDLRDF